ncbi:CoA pyrophosphatase [Sphingomonas sp. MA1305]|uniref:CoA pyrophosphatase n=1 Tax=Sphingomonas sp. MA1305 TaxID=2479204 RepID=UPI0018DF6902|nr:CoA pyrophosphatase [Sphingomonas sp. MA1305]MBI0475211.1 CoA pyrophosphatase [Sphingomonas sp. MA1305]
MTLVERLHAALAARRDATPELLTGDARELDTREDHELTPAAVLVAVTDRPEPGVLLTQRTETLRRHAGQVAFPGGRLDPGETAIAAALREAEEEIALPRERATVIGTIDTYRTITGFTVTPVLAAVPADLPLRPSEAEVASVFEVPLAFLLDPANHREASVEWQGRMRHFYEILWEDRRIWGATAAMIVNLSRRLAWR